MEKKTRVPNAYFEQVAAMLQEGKHVRLKVLGDSMFPIIRGGKDEIELVPRNEVKKLKLFTALFYQWQGQYMIHRYIRKEGNELILLGDGNVYREERVQEEDILGVLKTIYRKEKEIDCLSENWLRQGKRWYRLRPLRRYLLYTLKKARLFR